MYEHNSSLQRFLQRNFNFKDRSEDLYFNRLTKLSKGNIHKAIFLWLNSLELVDKQTFLVHKPKAILFKRIKLLSQENMILLSTVLESGSISSEQGAKILHNTCESTQALLDELYMQELLHKKTIDGKAYFSVRKLAVTEILEELKQRGIEI